MIEQEIRLLMKLKNDPRLKEIEKLEWDTPSHIKLVEEEMGVVIIENVSYRRLNQLYKKINHEYE